ncbi:MAG: hypothetical protein L6U99_04240 [Clostridium sp.]|nr:MAG: hypothetical protein L6U99_04240 [Clostridium sp.]
MEEQIIETKKEPSSVERALRRQKIMKVIQKIFSLYLLSNSCYLNIIPILLDA